MPPQPRANRVGIAGLREPDPQHRCRHDDQAGKRRGDTKTPAVVAPCDRQQDGEASGRKHRLFTQADRDADRSAGCESEHDRASPRLAPFVIEAGSFAGIEHGTHAEETGEHAHRRRRSVGQHAAGGMREGR